MTHEHETSPQSTDPNPFNAARLRIDQEKQQRKQESEAKRKNAEAAVEAAQAQMRDLLDNCEERELEAVLMRQGHLLNALLLRTVDAHAGPGLSGPAALQMMLKTQRECRQTVQAQARLRELNLRIDKALDEEKNPGKRTDSSVLARRAAKRPQRLYDEDGRLIYDFTEVDGDGSQNME